MEPTDARSRERGAGAPASATPTLPASPGAPRPRPAPRRSGWLTPKRLALGAIICVGLAYATMIQSFSWNQTSHYDLIRALNNGGTTIDAYQANTGDKVFYHGH